MVAMVMDYFSIAYEFYFSAKVMARTFEKRIVNYLFGM